MYYANANSYEQVPQDDIHDVDFYMVAGSMCGLHALADSITNPKSITVLDIEEDMTAFARAYIELIMASDSLNDFFKNLFCRDFGSDLRDLVRTSPQYLEVHPAMLPVHRHAALLRYAKPVGRRATRCGDPRPVQSLVLSEKKVHDYWHSDGSVEYSEPFHHYIGMAPDGAYEPEYINCIYPGMGWSSDEGYQKVREYLLTVPLTIATGNAFTYPYEDGGYVYFSGVITDLMPSCAIEVAKLMHNGKGLVLRDSRLVIENGESYWIPESRMKFTDERSIYYGTQR